MKLAAKTRYAARILLALAELQENELLTTTQLAHRTGITPQFIEQILKALKKGGLTQSTRGAAGGHALTRSPEEISLEEIVRLMEGGIQLALCCRDGYPCPRTATCPTKGAWLKATQALEMALRDISVADLMPSPEECQSITATENEDESLRTEIEYYFPNCS